MTLSLDMRMALCARANAKRQWPEIGFSDQFAGLLAHLLGISLKQRLPPLAERRLIQRSQWFDEACCNFFQRHPQAMCIELGAGLSTRFHRLSAKADWPQFRWVEVDLPQITAFKAQVMPAIDNYHLVGADLVQDDWLALSGWMPGQPLLVVCEGVPSMTDDGILWLLGRLRQGAARSMDLEVVFDIAPSRRRWFGWLAKWMNPQTPSIASSVALAGFKLVQQNPLLGNSAVGIVINYRLSWCE